MFEFLQIIQSNVFGLIDHKPSLAKLVAWIENKSLFNL